MKNAYLQKYVSSRGYFAKSFLKLTAICLLVFSGNIAWGQVATNYNFSQSTGTYTPITGGTVLGTASSAGTFDSQNWAIANGSIPFSFAFNGTVYSGLNVNSNGFVTFGTTLPDTYTSAPISSALGYAGAISAWGRDLNAAFVTAVIAGEVRWEVVGTAPSREFVIQFKDWRPVYSTSTTAVPFINFQIRLAETSNAIKIVYGSTGVAVGTSTTASTAQIGLRGAANTDYNNRTNPSTASFSASTAGTANNATQNFSYDATSASGLPASGLTYNWILASCLRPTAVTASAITPASATVSWTASASTPSGGYDYEVRTSGAAGSGATGLVASGSTPAGTTTFNVASLTNGTAYSVYVRANCGSGDLSLWTAATNFTTACVMPTAVTTSALGTTTATINWSNLTGAAANGYEYEVRTSGAAGSGATGLVTSNTTAAGVTTANLTSLTASTTYTVFVRANCGGGNFSAWTAAFTMTTLCISETVPTVTQSFETTGFPVCWSGSVVSGTNAWAPIGTNDGVPSAHTGTKFMGKEYANSVALAFSQPIDFSSAAATGSRMRVWVYRNTVNSATDKIRFYVNNTASVTGATQLLEIFVKTTVAPTVTAAGWYNYVVAIPASYNTATAGFIIAEGTTTAGFSAYGIGFDDMTIELIPSCTEPTALTAMATTATTGTFSWTASTSNPTDGYEYEVRTSGAAGSGVTGLTTSGTTASGVVTKNVTGLTANTTYSVYVRANCGLGAYSPWTAAATIYTGYCTPAPISVDNDGIIKVVVGTINNPTLLETGNYGDFTSMSTDLSIGVSDTVRITYGTAYTYGTKIWIDFNDDLDFTDAGELIYTGLSGSANPTTLKANILIPIGAAQGSHRMRIGGTDNDSGPSSPCYTGDYGTFEDYTVNIICPAVTPAPTAPMGDIICANETAVLSVTGITGATLTWYDAATAGAVVGTNNDTLTTAALTATTSYWVAQSFTGCAQPSARVEVVAAVVPVNLALTPINNTCNGYAAGSFSLGTVVCGTAPFQYSVNGGTFGAIPTNLAAGTYSVIVRDAALGLSQPISVVITQPTTVVPTPVTSNVTACEDATTKVVTAQSVVLMPGTPVVVSFDLAAQPAETIGAPGVTISTATMPALPAGAVVTSVTLSMPGITALASSWQADVRLGASGAIANAAAAGVGAANGAGTFNYTRVLPNNSVNIAGGTVNLLSWDNVNDNTSGPEATFTTGTGVATITIQYNIPNPSGVTWWTAATGGTQLSANSTLETIGNSVIASPAAVGTYTFYAQTESAGCSSITRAPMVVTVAANPEPMITASNPILCAGSSIMLVSSSATGNVWSTTATNDTITVATAGSFTVTVTDANGCVGTSPAYVTTITALPTISAGADQTVCENSSVTLVASGAPSLVWNNGVSNNTPFTVSATGSYIVTGTAANGCVNTDTVTVNVNANPVPVISGDLVICAGDSTLLVSSFETNNVWSTTQTNDSIYVSGAGSYTVTKTDANGCVGTSAPVVVSINALPTINAGANIAVCQNGQAILFATGAQTYEWTGNIANGVSFVATATQSYVVTGTDANGCENTDTVMVTVNPLPTVEAGMNQTLCGAGQVTLTATGATVYSWNNGVMNGAPFAAPVGTNVYVVTGIDTLGCSNTDVVTVTVNAVPVASATAANQLTIVAAPAGMSYQWINCATGTAILGANNQTFTASENGSYKVIVTAMGGCADTSACVNINSVGVEENSADLGITLYPNPTGGDVYVNMPASVQANITVYDAQGKVVSVMNNVQNGAVIDLKNVENGMYMIQVANASGSDIFRIVKN